MMEIQVKKCIQIRPGKVWLNGKAALTSTGKGDARDFLTRVYQWLEADYRKFFKMDLLSKLGWLASEWLMEESDPEQPKEDAGIVFFNSFSSLDSDSRFQETIQRREAYFPSPAGFVYTLPNIVTGEVAIRHRIRGETAFYVLPRPDYRWMAAILSDTMASAGLHCLLAGWLEAYDELLDARLMLCRDGGDGLCPLNARNMEHLFIN
ncbi:MAG: hypothetical protein LBB90_09450 [Tannerella sp.]|jgi:hypothetical protein|nr:hypothetical protein [Tannerella sp.]